MLKTTGSDSLEYLKENWTLKTNLFLFESIGIVDYLCEVFFFKLKSNYIEKLNIETEKTL